MKDSEMNNDKKAETAAVPTPPPAPSHSLHKEKPVSDHQRHLNEAKESAAKIINKDSPEINQELEIANKEREQILAKKSRYMKSPSSIQKFPKEMQFSNEKLYKEREDILKGIDEEIVESESRIIQLAKNIQTIEKEITTLEKAAKDPKEIKEILIIYKENLQKQEVLLHALKESKEAKISEIKSFAKNYESEIDKFEKEIQIKSVYINVLTTAALQRVLPKESRRKKSDLRKELIQKFAEKYRDFSSIENYSEIEIIKIRIHYFNNGHNGSTDSTDSAINWTNNTLRLRLQGDIKLENIDYFKFKEIIGRSVLDESSLSQVYENEHPNEMEKSNAPSTKSFTREDRIVTNEGKNTNRYDEMPLLELSQRVDELNEQSKQEYLMVEEIQKLVDIAKNPTYVFSFSFPPLYLVPTTTDKNNIEDELNKAQIRYQHSVSQALAVGAALNARVKKPLNLLAEFSNNPQTTHQNRIANMSQKELNDFVEYLLYQRNTLEKECVKHEKILTTLQGSFGRFFSKQKRQIEMATFNLSQAQASLKKVNKLETLLQDIQNVEVAKPQKSTEDTSSTRKKAVEFSAKESEVTKPEMKTEDPSSSPDPKRKKGLS